MRKAILIPQPNDEYDYLSALRGPIYDSKIGRWSYVKQQIFLFRVAWAGPAIIKMSVKATKNCVESLIAKGIHGSKIAVLTPIIVLDTVHLQSTKKDCACQAYVSSADSEEWFGSFLTDIDVTEKELDAILTESEEDNFLFGSIQCVIRAIKAMRVNWPQCLIQMLQIHLQSKGLELDVFESNSLLFTAFKQKRRLVVQNMKIARSRRFIPKLFV